MNATPVKISIPGLTGAVERIEYFISRYVEPRHIDIWLPAGFNRTDDRRYPVLYMHDGQNLFDPRTSPHTKVDWGIDAALNGLAAKGGFSIPIVVGVWNTPHRVPEYMPQKPPLSPEMVEYFKREYGDTPMSDRYLAMLVSEIKPLIDRLYPTDPGQQHTTIMGSSMGGLVSLYAICEYPDVFCGAGCVSTHWSAADGWVIEGLPGHLPDPQTHRIYFDYGTEGLDEEYEPYQQRVDVLVRQAGYEEGKNWMTRKFPGDGHTEVAWRKRVSLPLGFLLGGDS